MGTVKKIYLVLIIAIHFIFGQEIVNNHSGRFIFIGDTQHIGFWESLYWDYWGEHNQDKTKLMLNEIARKEPAFLLHLGDMTKDGSDKKAWKDFDQDNSLILDKNIPYYPVWGNHDYWGSEEDLFMNAEKRFPGLKNKRYYSLIFSNIGLIIINTNFDELSDEENSRQRDWFINLLEEFENNSAIKGVIVAGHHPPFTNSKIVSPNKEVQKNFVNPFLKRKKTILFLSGHCHSYEKFNIDGKYFVISGGGGGPRQKLEINKGKRKYKDLFNGETKRFFHFCEAVINNKKLSIYAVKLNKNGQFSIADSTIIFLQ